MHRIESHARPTSNAGNQQPEYAHVRSSHHPHSSSSIPPPPPPPMAKQSPSGYHLGPPGMRYQPMSPGSSKYL